MGASVSKCDAPPAPPSLPPLQAPGSPPPPSIEGDSSSSSSSNDENNNNTISIAEAAASATMISNPGPYDHALMDVKRLVSLDTHDGFRADIGKQVSPYMLVSHSFWLGTNMMQDGSNKTYTFTSQVADESGVFLARVDPIRGTLDGRVQRMLGPFMGKLQIVAGKEPGPNDQLLGEIDVGGMTWTGNLKYGSMGGGMVCGLNYFQSVTPSLALGGEGMYIAANGAMMSSYTGKYTGKDYLSCINYNLGQSTLTLHYKKDITPKRVAIGAELSLNAMSLQSQAMVGAEFNLTRSKIAMCIDGGGKIQSTVQASLGMAQNSPAITFTGEVDHAKDLMRFGFGLSIG